MVQSVTICVSYILNALFRDTPLAYFFVPPATYHLATCHLGTLSAKTIGKCPTIITLTIITMKILIMLIILRSGIQFQR